MFSSPIWLFSYVLQKKEKLLHGSFSLKQEYNFIILLSRRRRCTIRHRGGDRVDR